MKNRNDIQSTPRYAGDVSRRDELKPLRDLESYVREYTRERPRTVALACFAVGFILGWKLKPW